MVNFIGIVCVLERFFQILRTFKTNYILKIFQVK